jgi:hypothetical protein
MFPFGLTEIFWGTPDTGEQQLKSLEWGQRPPLGTSPITSVVSAIGTSGRVLLVSYSRRSMPVAV